MGDDRKNAGLMGADTRRLEEAELADVQVVFDRIEPAWVKKVEVVGPLPASGVK